MGRILVLVGLIAVLGAAVFVWTSEDATDDSEASEAPATVGQSRADRGRSSGAGTVLPDNATRAPRAASDPKPLAPPIATGAASATPEPSRPTRSISGTVQRLSDASPIAAVFVRVIPPDGETIEILTADDPAGTFTLTGVPLDIDELTLVSTGPWPERRATHAIEPGAHELTDLALRFDSGFAVSGRVTDEHDVPIPDAIVEAQRRGEITAESTGYFFLRDVAPGENTESVDIGARAPWYQRGTEAVVVPRDSAEVPNLHLRLMGSGAVEGRVTDDAGDPVSGATVEFAFLQTTNHGRSAAGGLDTTSDHDGRYRIDHVPPGQYIVKADPPDLDIFSSDSADVQADRRPRGLVGVWIADVGIVVGEATRLDVALPDGATVGGRITDQYGTPVTNATVLLERSVSWPAPDQRGSSTTTSSDLRIVSRGSRDGEGDGDGETVLTTKEDETTSDDKGEYLFGGVTPGEKQITASDTEGGRITQREALTVTRGRPHTRDIQLLTGLTMRSRVVDEMGAPIEGASVQVQPAGTNSFVTSDSETTDHDGRFELTGLQPAEMRLFIFKSGYVTIFEEVDTAAPKAQYVLQPAPSVRGRVLDALREEPITNFTVIVSVGGSTWSNQSNFEDGVFNVDVNDDELATVEIQVPGYTSESLENIRPSETAVRPLEFRLHRAD